MKYTELPLAQIAHTLSTPEQAWVLLHLSEYISSHSIDSLYNSIVSIHALRSLSPIEAIIDLKELPTKAAQQAISDNIEMAIAHYIRYIEDTERVDDIRLCEYLIYDEIAYREREVSSNSNLETTIDKALTYTDQVE